MKIIRAAEKAEEERPFGRTTKSLLEYFLPKKIESIALYLSYLPTGKFDAHYHPNCFEIIVFPKGGKIEVNNNSYELSEWDLVALEPGDIHGYSKDDCKDIIHFAIRLPAVKDRVSV